MEENPEEDVKKLGGNIELIGFSAIDPGSLVIVKKIVGSFARKITDSHKDFERLTVSLKKTDDSRYMINAELLIGGKSASSKSDEKNLFMALDKSLKNSERNI